MLLSVLISEDVERSAIPTVRGPQYVRVCTCGNILEEEIFAAPQSFILHFKNLNAFCFPHVSYFLKL